MLFVFLARKDLKIIKFPVFFSFTQREWEKKEDLPQPISLGNRCPATNCIILISDPYNEDYIKCCCCIVEKFWHDCLHTYNVGDDDKGKRKKIYINIKLSRKRERKTNYDHNNLFILFFFAIRVYLFVIFYFFKDIDKKNKQIQQKRSFNERLSQASFFPIRFCMFFLLFF